MAPLTRVDEFEDGRRGGAIPSVDQQPRALTRSQIHLGLFDVEHGTSLMDRLLGAKALREDREGVEWELGDFGLRVIRSLIESGEIFTRFRKLTGGQLPAADSLRHADNHIRSCLAQDAVSEGLRKFFQRVQAKEWDPSRGASLATYCSNGCVLEFKRPYEKWLKSLQEIPFGDTRDETLPDQGPDLQEKVADSVDLKAWIGGLDEFDRRIVNLIIDGIPPTVIAQRMKVSPENIRVRRRRLKGRWDNYLREREGND